MQKYLEVEEHLGSAKTGLDRWLTPEDFQHFIDLARFRKQTRKIGSIDEDLLTLLKRAQKNEAKYRREIGT